MARNGTGLSKAVGDLAALREEFWRDVRVPGQGEELNVTLEAAGRVADFLELGELMCRDALAREESCGTHFREEFQTPEGEALRDDERFAHVAAWTWQGEGAEPGLIKEELEFEDGRILNPRFSGYRVPRFRDVPRIDVHLIENRDIPPAGGGEIEKVFGRDGGPTRSLADRNLDGADAVEGAVGERQGPGVRCRAERRPA